MPRSEWPVGHGNGWRDRGLMFGFSDLLKLHVHQVKIGQQIKPYTIVPLLDGESGTLGSIECERYRTSELAAR